jgi:hypothetical protein
MFLEIHFLYRFKMVGQKGRKSIKQLSFAYGINALHSYPQLKKHVLVSNGDLRTYKNY